MHPFRPSLPGPCPIGGWGGGALLKGQRRNQQGIGSPAGSLLFPGPGRLRRRRRHKLNASSAASITSNNTLAFPTVLSSLVERLQEYGASTSFSQFVEALQQQGQFPTLFPRDLPNHDLVQCSLGTARLLCRQHLQPSSTFVCAQPGFSGLLAVPYTQHASLIQRA